MVQQRPAEEHANKVELFRGRNGNVFADVYEGAIRLTLPVQSKFFWQWLARTYFETTGKIAPLGQLRAMINLIEARAQVGVPEREVFVRVGEHDGRIYLDLADGSWSAIEVDAKGWRVEPRPPVRFVRTPGMSPLPVPAPGGSIEVLRSLLNVTNEQDFVSLGARRPNCRRRGRRPGAARRAKPPAAMPPWRERRPLRN